MKLFFVLIAVSICGFIKAQEYNVLLIPDSLRKGADVVKRSEEYILTIKSASKYTLSEKHAYTILNASANHYASFTADYDKFCSINSVSGKLFNAMGKEIKHSKKNDWTDNSDYDGVSLLSDARYKDNEFYSADYPYTVEYEEEEEHNGTQGFPQWIPQSTQTMSVQNSRFTIIAPASYKVRYKQVNFKGEPVITHKGDVVTYTWEMKNITTKKVEASAPSFLEVTPAVFFAPSKFEVQGHSGDMSTWEGYGKFKYELIKGRDVLLTRLKATVKKYLFYTIFSRKIPGISAYNWVSADGNPLKLLMWQKKNMGTVRPCQII